MTSDWSFRIFRGPAVPSLTEIAHEPIPWTDPEEVLAGTFPELLFYQVKSAARIALTREGESVTIVPF